MGGSKHETHKAKSASERGKLAKQNEDRAEEKNKTEDDDSSASESEDIFSSTSLDLSKHAMPETQGLAKTLSQFKGLQKLDMSEMKASEESPNGLDSLVWLEQATARKKGEEKIFGDQLTWLKISGNAALGGQSNFHSWSGLEKLTSLAASALLRLSNLAALILAHNSIKTLSHLPHLPQLNTLVLSHNKIAQLPANLAASRPSLKKLSITHNALEWKDDVSPLPNFSMCSHLREVRISGNKKMKRLPFHLSTWGRGEGSDKLGTGLATLDAADCGFDDWEDVNALCHMTVTSKMDLMRQRGLSNLTLKGNKVANMEDYKARLFQLHLTLKTLDGERIQKVKRDQEDTETTPKEDEDQQKIHHADQEVMKGRKTRKSKDEEKSTSDDFSKPEEKTKLRKRGKRGGSGNSSKEAPTEAVVGEDTRASKKQIESKIDNLVSSESSADRDRVMRRAGPAPAVMKTKKRKKESKADEIDKSEGQARQKKRKAWDEGDGNEVKRNKEQVVAPVDMAKKNEKSLTSVAAVVNLKKKDVDVRKSKPKEMIWGKLKQTEESLGTGAGWM